MYRELQGVCRAPPGMLSPVEARRARRRIWSSQSQGDRLKTVLGRAEAKLEFVSHSSTLFGLEPSNGLFCIVIQS